MMFVLKLIERSSYILTYFKIIKTLCKTYLIFLIIGELASSCYHKFTSRITDTKTCWCYDWRNRWVGRSGETQTLPSCRHSEASTKETQTNSQNHNTCTSGSPSFFTFLTPLCWELFVKKKIFLKSSEKLTVRFKWNLSCYVHAMINSCIGLFQKRDTSIQFLLKLKWSFSIIQW